MHACICLWKAGKVCTILTFLLHSNAPDVSDARGRAQVPQMLGKMQSYSLLEGFCSDVRVLWSASTMCLVVPDTATVMSRPSHGLLHLCQDADRID